MDECDYIFYYNNTEEFLKDIPKQIIRRTIKKYINMFIPYRNYYYYYIGAIYQYNYKKYNLMKKYYIISYSIHAEYQLCRYYKLYGDSVLYKLMKMMLNEIYDIIKKCYCEAIRLGYSVKYCTMDIIKYQKYIDNNNICSISELNRYIFHSIIGIKMNNATTIHNYITIYKMNGDIYNKNCHSKYEIGSLKLFYDPIVYKYIYHRSY